MRPKFELFTRCLGLTLVCAGLLLSIRLTTQWVQPSPNVSGVWASGVLRQIEQQVAPHKPFPDGDGASEAIAAASRRAYVSDLLSLGLFPGMLGALLLLSASRLAARFYRDDSPATPLPATPLPATPLPANPSGDGAPRPAAHSASVAPVDSDRRYAPPGHRG